MVWTAYDLIPPAVGLIGGGLSGFYSARAALKSWQRSRQDSAAKLAVELIRELTTELARASHFICWLTWKAKYDPAGFSNAHTEKYDDEMHKSLPKLLGHQAALATIDSKSAEKLDRPVDMICLLDAEVGAACVEMRAGHVEPLASLHDKVLENHFQLLAAFRDVSANVLGSQNNLVIR